MNKYFLFFLIFVFSCQQKKEWNAHQVCETIFLPDGGQFKNFEIGMTKKAFDDVYTGNAIYSTTNELIDSLTIDDFVYCETAFHFYKNHLSEIVVRIEVKDEEKKQALLKAILDKIKKDYGDFLKEQDYYVWRLEGALLTTDLYLSEQAPIDHQGGKKFVISLYYTVGTDVS